MSKETKDVAVIEKNISDGVLNRVKELEKTGALQFPPNYSYSNALKSAWLIIQETTTGKNSGNKPVLEVCTKESIANSLLDMVVQGLSPVKKQCYFIAYDNKLQLSRSYMGTVAVTKRLKGIKDVKAYCIYEGDEFETEFDVMTATLKITKFNPKFENVDITKIKGAFAVIIGEDGPVHLEIMSMAQIKAAWSMGHAKGGSGAHKDFTDEMAKKSVINRACKMYANTSDDSDVLIEAFNNTTENDSKDPVREEIVTNANTEELDFTDDEPNEKVVDVEYTEVESNEGSKQMKMGAPY